MKNYLALLSAVCLMAPAAVLAASNPAGVWEGTLKTPNGDLGITFNIHRDGDKWVAEADVPVQGVSGLPIGAVKVDAAAISFTMPGGGDPHYEGKLSEDGKTIAGTFNAGGQTIPMNLTWKSEPKAVVKVPANTGDVQALEGVWEGVLDANGNQLHLRFNFTKNADGTIAGTLDSLDQGANGLPIASMARTGDTVKLDLKVISGSYEGTLSKDASSMSGTFQQGPGPDLPLNLKRKMAEKKN